MIVIGHSPSFSTLPQPSGPGIKVDGLISSDVQCPNDDVDTKDQLHPKAGRRTRVMGRSTSMFHPPTLHAPPSSRSVTPASSTESSRASSRHHPLSTPASTVHSESIQGRCSSPRTLRSQPYVEISIPDPCLSSLPADVAHPPGLALGEDPSAIPYEVPLDIPIPPFAHRSTNVDRDLARVWEAVASARRITVICGAGISVSSPANIPDFRSTAGLFRKLKEKHPTAGLTSGKDLFDASLFNSASTSSIFYSMIAELKAMADAASPTTFHHLLKRLDMEGRLQRVYTQNIDGLEERAGLSFGLGESGDSRATLRALGKRKRGLQKEPGGPAAGFARSKSDSAVLFTQKQEADRLAQEGQETAPMFPRTIPLHGSLSTLTCAVCGHKIYLSLASSGPQRQAFQRELSPGAADQALAAMDLLSQGEPVYCVKCEDYERVRSVAGLRSRGVGIMKVDVVLYNGQNDGAEQVGECVQRDILGLRDPNEARIPESTAEKMARERKERKERDVEDKQRKEALANVRWTLDPISEASSADDAFASAFGDEDESAKVVADVVPVEKKQVEAPRRKPLPPDLLIVAGTSLKVPGTKRIVREFAKACHARDRRVYPDSDSSDEEHASDSKKAGKRTSRRRSTRGEEDAEEEGEEEEEEEEEEEDINAPIRTVLLNYDFPVPPSQWEGVFDVWVQGDVQQSALGLWEASKQAVGQDCVNGFSMRDDENHQLSHPSLSWLDLQTGLEEERKANKKVGARRGSSQQDRLSAAKAASPSSQSSRSSTPKNASQTTRAGKTAPVKGASAAKETERGTEKVKAAPKTTKKAASKSVSAAPKTTKPKAKTATAAGKKCQEVGLQKYMNTTKSGTKSVGGSKKTVPTPAA